jgi:hypothetical protein
MSALCHALHHLVDQLKIHTFPFYPELFPKNGVYVLLEKGEKAHGVNRIVRIGTHTGKDQLRSRLSRHFVSENKDRSIFRKNIGRALLNQNADSFLRDWNLDLTTAAARRMHGAHIDSKKQQTVEQQVTAYMRSNFRFVFSESMTRTSACVGNPGSSLLLRVARNANPHHNGSVSFLPSRRSSKADCGR